MQSHPTLCYPSEINAICKPLKSLKIDYFSHVKIDADSNFSAICNNPEFCQYYYENKHYNADIHMAKENKLGDIILWDALTFDNKSAILAEEAKAFGVNHVFTIVESKDNEMNYYHFAANVNSLQINQSYLANVDLLKLFTRHFNECINSTSTLKSGHDLKFSLLEESNAFSLKDDACFNMFDIDRWSFLSILNPRPDIQTNKLILKHKGKQKSIQLSNQQEKCLRLLVLGLSAKQIALKLKISYRTVEHHVAIIKRILGCQNTKEVIASYGPQLRPYGLPEDLIT